MRICIQIEKENEMLRIYNFLKEKTCFLLHYSSDDYNEDKISSKGEFGTRYSLKSY